MAAEAEIKKMEVVDTEIQGVKIVEPKIFHDKRGWFYETFSGYRYEKAGIKGPFVQDNLSKGSRGTLRGLHLQEPHAQGKLVWVVEGEVFDVAVDVRMGSPTFGKHVAVELSSENRRQLWVPPGFAHGFCVTSQVAIFAYKCTAFYHVECEVGIAWNDPDLGIAWPLSAAAISEKDSRYHHLKDIDTDKLPKFKELPREDKIQEATGN